MRNKRSLLRKLLKWLGIGAIVLVLLFWLAIGPWPVDRSPIEGSGFYQTSLESIDRCLASPARASGLEAGFAAIPLDLPEGLPLAGYGARRGAPSEGTHDPIRAKAAAIRAGTLTAAIVGADILLVNEALAADVADRLAPDLPRENLYFVATHTHSGPGGWGTSWAENLVAGQPSPEGCRVLAEGMAGAVRSAIANLAVATLSYGKASAPEYIRNRLLGGEDTPTDPSLQVARFTGTSGEAIGTLSAMPLTRLCLGPTTCSSAAEYPGSLERELEEGVGRNRTLLRRADGEHEQPGRCRRGFRESRVDR